VQDQRSGKQKAIAAPPLGLTVGRGESKYLGFCILELWSGMVIPTIMAVLCALRGLPTLVRARPSRQNHIRQTEAIGETIGVRTATSRLGAIGNAGNVSREGLI